MKPKIRYVPFAVAACAVLFAASQARADYPSTVASLNPVGYYRLSNTTPVADDIATNYGSAGAIGNGYYFGDSTNAPSHGETDGPIVGDSDGAMTTLPTGGTQGWFQVPFRPEINPLGAFTFEAWVTPTVDPTAVSGGLACIASYGHLQNPTAAPNRSGWLLYQDSGTSSDGHGFNFRMYNHNGLTRVVTLEGGPVQTVGEWEQVVVTFDGVNVIMYVNGVVSSYVSGTAVSSVNGAAFVANADGNFSVGTRNDQAFSWDGEVAQVALYTNALSPATILAHYQSGLNASRAIPYHTLVEQSNPLLYYRLNEPVFTPTDPTKLPTSPNLGSWGSAQDAQIEDNVLVNQPGVPTIGFPAGNIGPFFNGLEGSIDITNPPVATTTLTMTAWVKRYGIDDPAPGTAGSSQGLTGGGWAGILFERGQVAGVEGVASGISFGDQNDLRETWNNSANDYGWVPSPRMVIPDYTWSFVACSFGTSNAVLCLNGILATNENHDTNLVDFSQSVMRIGCDDLGALTGSGARIATALIDEVAIFDYALSADQLVQLYNAGQQSPIITGEPVGPTNSVFAGGTLALSVSAIGALPLTYTWTKGGTPISGQTAASLSNTNLGVSDGGNYAVIVANAYGSVTSSITPVTVISGAPTIPTEPLSVSRYLGGHTTFSVVAAGSAPITYQWSKGAIPIPGATNATYSLSDIQTGDAATYSVVVTNPHGSTPSTPATLSILPVTSTFLGELLARGPVSLWRLNETNGTIAHDSVGGYDGTFSAINTTIGAPGTTPPAFPGMDTNTTAFSFDGNTSDLSTAPLNETVTSATILCFINPQTPPSGDTSEGLVFCRGAGADIGGISLATTSQDITYVWNNGAVWDSQLQAAIGGWNFVALVVDTDHAVVYLDNGSGLANSTNAVSSAPEAFTVPIHIGDDPVGNAIYKGTMDGVAFFDHALSGADIQAIHDAAYLNTGTTNVPPTIGTQPVAPAYPLFVGDNYTLTAAATGSQPLTYQWTLNGIAIPGATSGLLNITDATLAQGGTYEFLAIHGSTIVTSAPVVVVVETPPNGIVLTTNLLLHLKFNGNLNDSSGLGNNAVVAGGNPGYKADGALGQAIHLDNSNFLVINDPNQFLLFDETVSFSVSLWMRFTVGFNDLPVIGNALNSTYRQGWVLTEDQGEFEWSLGNDPAGAGGTYAVDDPAGPPLINDGAWHNCVATFNRTNELGTAYVDGRFVSSVPITVIGSLVTPYAIYMGNDPSGTYAGGPGNSFDVDDVGIWNYSLNPIQARTIYFAGKAGNSFDTPATPPRPTMTLTRTGSTLIISYPYGVLQSSPTANAPDTGWTNVPGAAAPSYTVTLPKTGSLYYRLHQ